MYTKMLSALLLLGALFFVYPLYAQSSIPRILTYQGQIIDKSGHSITDGKHTLTITLYGDVAGARKLWSTSETATITGGLFTVLLGSDNNPLPSAAEFNTTVYIGTSIDGTAEMRPLTLLTASPYALAIPDKSVTKEKLAADYIGGIAVNGKRLPAKGDYINLKDGTGINLLYDDETNSISLNTSFGIVDGKPQWVGNNPCSNNSDGGVATNTIGGGCSNGMPNTASYASIIGGFRNHVKADYSVVAGGDTNVTLGAYSNIGGGHFNNISADYSVIAGGEINIASGAGSSILGGSNNTASGSSSTLGGGVFNLASGSFSTIGGGVGNIASGGFSFVGGGGYTDQLQSIPFGNYATGIYSAIMGGLANLAQGDTSVLVGGSRNQAIGKNSTVGGGRSNIATNDFSSLLGGNNNTTSGDTSVVSGGSFNMASGVNSTIAGGWRNTASGDSSFVGGGGVNTASGQNSVVAGGAQNTASGLLSVISGGGDITNAGGNIASAQLATVAGGTNNKATALETTVSGGATNNATNQFSVVSGGTFNTASGESSVAAGGRENTSSALGSVVSGGKNNTSSKNGAFIGGGINTAELPSPNNKADGINAVVTGGMLNEVDADEGSIGGGTLNNINALANDAAISGGKRNTIKPGGFAAAIPGGDSLFAQSYAQIVMGHNNKAQGTSTKTAINGNDRLLIIGNGVPPFNVTPGTPSNAFEVSNNGHSIVYHQNGSGLTIFSPCTAPPPTGTPAIIGATYTDNICYAWGDIVPTIPPLPICSPFYPFNLNPASDFGVKQVVQTGVGTYTITLNDIDPDGVTAKPLNSGAVTATLVNGKCGETITVSPISGGVFTVTITVLRLTRFAGGPDSGQLDGLFTCDPVDEEFAFHVFGRP